MDEDSNALFYNEEKLKYVSKLLNLKTKDIAKKLGVQDSFISKLYDYGTGKLKPIHLYAFSKAYNIPMVIFEDESIDSEEKVKKILESYQSNKSIFKNKDTQILDELLGDWYMYSYPSNLKQAELWEVKTTFYEDGSVVDEYKNRGFIHIGKNQSIILKESACSKNITSITFDNYSVYYKVFLFSRVSKSNGVNQELFNFGICSKNKIAIDEVKKILGDREKVQMKIDSLMKERISSYMEIS